MEAQPDHPFDEIGQLRRCINDVVSLLGLPAIWIGGDASMIGRTLRDVLFSMLDLDLVYVRLSDPAREEGVEVALVGRGRQLPDAPAAIGKLLGDRFGHDSRTWPRVDWISLDDGDLSVTPLPLGLHGDAGIVVAGSGRAGFPTATERLLLSVAANQAAIGLQEARVLGEQKRLARELDRRVAERTRELAAANEELRKEIAEHALAAGRLRRSEAFLADAQRLSLTGSFAWRVGTDEITWSDQLYRIFELDPDTPVTLERIVSRVHPEDVTTLGEMIARGRRAGSDLEFEHRLQMPDRSVKHLRIVAHAIRDRDGALEYIGAVQDVTERRTSEAALNKARADLAHVARATSLGILTASIAHEVNQPLSGIITNASTCHRMLLGDPPNVDGALETARRTIRDGHRASDVITRLRGLFARKDFTAEPVDLNEATREVIALSMSELQIGRVILRTELAEDLAPVTGDRVQLQQVVLNLLRNAADAMGGVEDRPRKLLVRTEEETGGAVRLSVRDAGTGIAPDTVDGLFEAFYTTKSAGMGIGLSVSRSIVESHHGRLWAAPNDDGPGATFAFSIPRWPMTE
jgi:signal transduction histidine kinase